MEWTPEQTVRLIRSLKRHEILWNSRSKCYRDRKKKAMAWSTVEAEVGIPVDICKRRVESLLASCRRERNKISKSKSMDEPEFVYEPKWIYWKEFKFLRGIPDEDGDTLGDSADLTQPIIPQWSPSARRPPRKRRKVKEVPKPDETQWKAHKPQREGDEHDAFGITVAAKLRKMEENQRLFAENIINQTLYKGMLFQLTPQTETEVFSQHRMVPHQQEPQHQQTDQWQTHTFNALTGYATKTNTLPVVVQHQPNQESSEEFKQTMLSGNISSKISDFVVVT